MSDMDRIKSKLQKLLALARQGVGGERDNARSVMNKLLARHGLTIDDLDDASEVRETRWFKPRNAKERVLLNHCVMAAVPGWDRSVWRSKSSSARHGYDLTTAEFAQVDLLYEIHRKAMAKFINKQKEAALTAYLSTNRLFAHDDGESGDSDEAGSLSPDDLAAILAMMAGLKPTPVHKAITNNSGAQGGAA